MAYLDAHLAKLRLEEDLHTDFYQRYIDGFDKIDRKSVGGLVPPGTHAQAMADTLRAAETFTITVPMTQLIAAAAREMPDEPLMPQDLPSNQGFLYLPEPLAISDIRGRSLHAHAVLWSLLQYEHVSTHTQKVGVMVDWFTDRNDPEDEVNQQLFRSTPTSGLARYMLMASQPMYFGELLQHSPKTESLRALNAVPGMPTDWHSQYDVRAEPFIDIDADTTVSTTKSHYVVVAKEDSILTGGQLAAIQAVYDTVTSDMAGSHLKQLVCFWRLCQQTIAAREYVYPDRAVGKLLKRRKFSASPVTVITLRRQQHRREVHGIEVEWDHRWLRRGHWRNQWYGHGGERYQRAIYINPTICGPEDKPLLLRPHINLLAR
jgi:hypothetical protein